jgi:hypothetical protein
MDGSYEILWPPTIALIDICPQSSRLFVRAPL